MMFGRAPGKGIPKVTVGSGEQAGYAASEDNRLSESTVRVDLDALAGDLGGTTDDSPQVRHDRTVLFAMKTEGAGAGPAAVPPAPAPAMERDRSNQTVLFAMNPAADDAAESPVFEGELASGAAPALPVVQGVPQTTLIFAGNPGGSPTSHQGVGDPDAQDSSSGSTAPEIPPIEPGRLDLPPEDRFLHAAATVANEPTAPDEEAIARLRAAANRRTTIAVVVFLALALGLALALVWYLFGKALVGGSSAALEAQAREVIALLRRDDEAAHRGAMTRARALLEHAPRSVDAQAALVLATAFATDDASARARRHRDQSEAIRRRLDRLSDQSPSRPELARQLELARDESRGATADAEVLQGALKTETQTLLGLAQTTEKLPPAQQLAALRARSVSLAVQGEATALALAEEFNQKAGTPDVWNDLALPEYVANGGSSYDEAQRQLEAIEARDDTFLRAYVLSARIALLRRDTPGAEAQLAKVLAFHPGHDAALQLLAWVRTHRQDD
jgi:hypothetical protein